MLRFDDARRTLELGVHDLIEVGPPQGDLALQVAWSARARMRAGQVVHSRWQSARAAGDEAFQAEVTIRHRLVVRGWEVTISGRIDGLSREGDHLVVEEVKSTPLPEERLGRATAADFPAWTRQVQLYLHFLAAASPGEGIVGRLVLVSLADGSQRLLHVNADAGIATWITCQLDHAVHRREARIAWLARRRQAGVPFAYSSWRDGQEGLAREVADGLHQGRHLLLSAPTGFGKTAAVLHAALNVAWETDRRVFFATARTPQQAMVESTLRAMVGRGLQVRVVSIRAREKACLNRDPAGRVLVACRPDTCRFAAGYFDKLRGGDVLDAVWTETGGVPGANAVIDAGAREEACPFALSLDLAQEADLVVGDLNYFFDPAVRIAPVADDPGDWIGVVDEAHNLPDRAMGYGSPEARIETAAAAAAIDGPRYRACRELARDTEAWLRAGVDRLDAPEEAFPLDGDAGLDRPEVRALAERFDGLALEYALLKVEAPAFGLDDPWMDLARSVLRLRSALDRAGPETVALWKRGTGGGLTLLCRDPSPLLGPAFAGLAASVSMSATLDPPDFYRSMLGLPGDRSAVVHRPSPFPPENRRVLVLPQVSTEFRHRERDRAATAALVSECVAAVPGNVAVYFPSFAWRDAVLPLADLGGRPVLVQGRTMSESARAETLSTLRRGEGHVLVAVLGGIFSEGVDLPGEGLLGAVVVGPALPQANLARRLLQDWYQERYGQGFRYAWLVPGMSRVVQAAGRVVRTPEDRGAIMLICRRFLLREYQELFPPDWRPRRSASPADDLAGLWTDPPESVSGAT